MNKFLIRWIINSLAVWAAAAIVPGIRGAESWLSFIALGLILTLVNAFVRPLVKFIGCLPIILTLGLFTLVINAFLFWLTGVVGQAFGVGFTIDSAWDALFGSLIVSAVSIVMGWFLKDELKGRRK